MLGIAWLLVALLLVFLNAFFVAAEFGMVKLRETRIQEIKESYGLRGIILEKVHKHLDAYLSACQLGITLASLGLGWVGEPVFAHLLKPVFSFFGVVSRELITVAAFLTAFLFLSFLHIVLGELVPKSLAIRQSEAVSVWTAVPLYGFYWLMYPAIWLLNSCSNFILKVARLNVVHRGEYYYSTEEIQRVLQASHLHGELTKDEAEILKHTLEFADLSVTEVMRPKEEIIMLDIDQSVENLVKTMMEQRYSRYPVYDNQKQDIIGIIHVKDLFADLNDHKKITSLRSYVRPILKVSYRLPAIDLLRKFREGMPHFALVYGPERNLLGFVTLDNLLHILIGRIQDEFHRTIDDWVKNKDGSLSINGKCSIYSLERVLDQDIDLTDEEEEELDTVAGLIVSRLGYFPKEGERIPFKEFEAIIESTEGHQIHKIKIIPVKREEKPL